MAEITKKDLFDTLTEFYGTMIEPEVRAIRSKLDEHDQRFKDLLEHFDKIYGRLDRLETEYFSMNAAIDRIERQLDGINEKLDKEISIRDMIEKEIKDLKQRAAVLQERIEDLEKRLKTFS